MLLKASGGIILVEPLQGDHGKAGGRIKLSGLICMLAAQHFTMQKKTTVFKMKNIILKYLIEKR